MDLTIIEAIKKILRDHGSPMTATEIYEAIVARHLYSFKAMDPLHIVQGQIRRHCKGLDLPSSSPSKHFEITADGKYWVLAHPIRANDSVLARVPRGSGAATLSALKALQRSYENRIRMQVLAQLRAVKPSAFEHFSARLLEAYGFQNTKVTRTSKDGGIDGSGLLRVGLAHMKVAFQCKRWNRNTVGRPDIDQFRGAIQGEFEQGVFFTTAHFTKEAKKASFKRGAVPVVLIDGPGIVDLMVERQLGIQSDTLRVIVPALELAVEPQTDGDSMELASA